jgi:hypothetical protein
MSPDKLEEVTTEALNLLAARANDLEDLATIIGVLAGTVAAATNQPENVLKGIVKVAEGIVSGELLTS